MYEPNRSFPRVRAMQSRRNSETLVLSFLPRAPQGVERERVGFAWSRARAESASCVAAPRNVRLLCLQALGRLVDGCRRSRHRRDGLGGAPPHELEAAVPVFDDGGAAVDPVAAIRVVDAVH